MNSAQSHQTTGAVAAAAPALSPWRPLLVRAAIGTVALFGLSGIGAFSMLAGLDGAHASPPATNSAWSQDAAVAPSASALPVAAANPPSDAAATAPASPNAGSSPTPQNTPCPSMTDDGRVILNRAEAGDLRKIPGIGPKRAEAIVALRAKLKRFKRSSDLLRVRGIGPKSLARMQSHFVLDPPPGSSCVQPPAPPQ